MDIEDGEIQETCYYTVMQVLKHISVQCQLRSTLKIGENNKILELVLFYSVQDGPSFH